MTAAAPAILMREKHVVRRTPPGQRPQGSTRSDHERRRPHRTAEKDCHIAQKQLLASDALLLWPLRRAALRAPTTESNPLLYPRHGAQYQCGNQAPATAGHKTVASKIPVSSKTPSSMVQRSEDDSRPDQISVSAQRRYTPPAPPSREIGIQQVHKVRMTGEHQLQPSPQSLPEESSNCWQIECEHHHQRRDPANLASQPTEAPKHFQRGKPRALEKTAMLFGIAVRRVVERASARSRPFKRVRYSGEVLLRFHDYRCPQKEVKKITKPASALPPLAPSALTEAGHKVLVRAQRRPPLQLRFPTDDYLQAVERRDRRLPPTDTLARPLEMVDQGQRRP